MEEQWAQAMVKYLEGVALDFLVQTEPLDKGAKVEELASLMSLISMKYLLENADNVKSGSINLDDLNERTVKAKQDCKFYNRCLTD